MINIYNYVLPEKQKTQITSRNDLKDPRTSCPSIYSSYCSLAPDKGNQFVNWSGLKHPVRQNCYKCPGNTRAIFCSLARNGVNTVPNIWYPTFGTQHLVPNIWYPTFRTQHFVPNNDINLVTSNGKFAVLRFLLISV